MLFWFLVSIWCWQLVAIISSVFPFSEKQNNTELLDWRLENKVRILEVPSFWLQWGQGGSVWYLAELTSHVQVHRICLSVVLNGEVELCYFLRNNTASFCICLFFNCHSLECKVKSPSFAALQLYVIHSVWSTAEKKTSAVWVHWEKNSYKLKSILLAKWILVKWKLILQLSQWVTAGRSNPYSFSLFCGIFCPHMLCDVTLPSCFSQCCGLILYITKCELNALPGFIQLPMEAPWKGARPGTGRSGGVRDKVPLSFLWSGGSG